MRDMAGRIDIDEVRAEVDRALVEVGRSALPTISRCWRRVANANAVKPARHSAMTAR